MISRKAAGKAQANFGWKVVGAAFVLAVFGWGIGFYGPSVFLRTLHDERGWPIALVSAAITAHFLFSALFVACLPEAYARWGLKRVTQAGISALRSGRCFGATPRRPGNCFRSRRSAERARRRRPARRSTRSWRRGSIVNGQRR